MQRRNIYFPDRLWYELEKLADALEISISELIRRILDNYIATVENNKDD